MLFDELDFLSDEDKAYMADFFEDSQAAFLERVGMSEDEYRQVCSPYVAEAESFAERIKKYKGVYKALEKEGMANVAREEYSAAGEAIHRGVYCPSLIQDIVVGNIKRGKLCRPDDPKRVYTHYFDSENRHIATKKQDGDIVVTEWITYSGNTAVGVTFSGKHLESIAECVYTPDGNIEEYRYVVCGASEDQVLQYDKEVYTYADDRLTVTHSSWMPDSMMLSVNKYVFRVESGYLKEYAIEMFDLEDMQDQPLEGRVFPVKIKRKI